ncbi:hypothetical protein AMTR_s00005p00200200 [Amborella trichopoda]|uniref:Uncharacterized protein n=1 Tax=Amborella trichopoda TaxID=13333 RepID=W1PGH8_AMBTC|nr:hypothetical protein AMTR_s00005p00200200 [Amborella trichopoda]
MIASCVSEWSAWQLSSSFESKSVTGEAGLFGDRPTYMGNVAMKAELLSDRPVDRGDVVKKAEGLCDRSRMEETLPERRNIFRWTSE